MSESADLTATPNVVAAVPGGAMHNGSQQFFDLGDGEGRSLDSFYCLPSRLTIE
ncbi:MAG: hypothetical protein AAF283_05825 [Cyanobacteria bacterium P01_A01_bin.70]